MKTTQIETKELLIILKTNMENHISDYEEAVQDRKELYRKTLMNAIDVFRENGTIKEFLKFPEVELMKDEYEKAIRKMELEVRSEIELDDREFDQFVMDNWHWKDQFIRSATMYKSGV